MDWGNAIVRSKTVDAFGKITAITMELHLDGDFRKTKNKITWLSAPTTAHLLVNTTLLDYDYLITKKKLEEDDKFEDFVTPTTEFREEAVADANVRELRKGDIIQFERKGYYILDGVTTEGKYEFIHIPDGRAASIASKAGAAAAGTPAAGKNAGGKDVVKASDTPADTKMYKVAKVYGDDDVIPPADTKMYKVPNVYAS